MNSRAASETVTSVETGLDYFEARYMSSAQGRSTSPDPLVWQTWASGPPEARAAFQEWISDPQNLNLYSYVRNNPLKYTDPHGLKYQVGDANGNCAADQLSDEEFEKEKKRAKAAGEYFKGGKFYHYDANGQKVVDGTYRQTDVDLNANAQSFFSDNKELWRNTAGAVNTAAAATAVVVAAPVIANAALSLSTMQIAVGPGVPYGIHVAYQANGTWLHGIRNIFGNIEVTADAAAAYASRMAWFKLTLPIANPGAVVGTAGSSASNCLTAACGAFLKGWGF